MRQDQRIRLMEVSERLAEAVLLDADPNNWAGTGKTLMDMTKDERGDAAWCRKTAVQSVALLVRVEQLLRDDKAQVPGDGDPDPQAEIERAEKAASAALARAMAKG